MIRLSSFKLIPDFVTHNRVIIQKFGPNENKFPLRCPRGLQTIFRTFFRKKIFFENYGKPLLGQREGNGKCVIFATLPGGSLHSANRGKRIHLVSARMCPSPNRSQ